ncbi:fibronectin type-III domain-containing protein 3A isoform X1 [Latimeria chalumnae]|uniref:Fibronectin type-III domain-containing protein n=1 Tax=Latimeria chalumnae TaxID=7897 RepID=H3AE26_LATCH|nr:PREDICTED: fibronectin type-III domain-containing protein 3A-like isoform X1 [Latimeria chalumnae]|eukprot:XP_006008926.1 PREDICTED: fibronectin type-III domain-containing protein 3A-like isoform X1 [Latimeria chalumnae]
MIIPAMMADQPPPLEATPLLNEVALLPHIVNGDNSQQVILVQVNPGETFTIRTEDGHIQCIQGPAHVPMVSPNGSVPPIFVPHGYISQVVEENGVRKVVVLPHSTEFHPSVHPPPPHVPHYMHPHPHPALLPHPPHPVYPPVPATGEIPPQYVHQHPPPPHVYTEQEPRSHGRTHFIHRDERTVKMQEHLRKRLKDKQAGGHNKNSPPPSPHKSHNNFNVDVQNGCGRGHHVTGGPVKQKPINRMRGSPPADAGDSNTELKHLQDLLSNISKPVVSDIQARSARISWSLLLTSQNGENHSSNIPATLMYEAVISNSGKNGKFKSVYFREEASVTLSDLRPATDYHVKVSAMCNSVKGSASELVNFTTESSEPDIPAPPKLFSRTKNSLSLQWKAPNDNGSKITNYLLEWDEGKLGAFKECYFGHLKQYKLTKLFPFTRYTFKLAAKNDIGMSGFSEAVLFYTSGSVPPAPAPPQLVQAGVTWLSLEWCSPSGISSEESLTYVLEMEEESSGYGFKPKHNGEELSCTLKNLRRSTSYKFRVFACNIEGKSNPSQVVEYSTCPDKPGPPSKPSIKGKIHAHSLKVVWDSPKNNGGSEVTEYILEISETLSGSKWDVVYSDTVREYVCDHLKPGTWYRLRVYCINLGGQSQVSEILSVQTTAVPPGVCQPLRLSGRAKPKELTLRWAPPPVDGGSQVTEYAVEMAESEQGEHRQVYRGPELECTVNNLLPGRAYYFWIKAANKAGYGPVSEKSDISTAPGLPDQSCIPLLTCKAATCVLVNWESPACNGAEITEYRLEWGEVEGCMQALYSGSCLSYEVRGLVPAATYYCRVQAVNVVGAGLFSDVALVTTPVSVPAAVSILQELQEQHLEIPLLSPSSCLAIQWEEPSCHGSEIIGYNIEYGEKQLVSVGRVTSYILENLQAETTYRIRIQAVNDIGVGPFSHSIKAKTKSLPPDPPHLECVVFSHQSLKLKWGEGPSKALITNNTQFNLQMEDKYGRFVCIYSGPCHTYKVQRLNESTAYNFKIQAYSDVGEGALSEVYTFTTTKSPPPPLKAPKIQQLKDNLCEVTWEALQPMKGDPIVYTAQLVSGRDVEQVYKGPETSFRFMTLEMNCEYRCRVCAGRRYQDVSGIQELCGPYSPYAVFSSQKQELVLYSANTTVEATKAKKKSLSDEQFAFLILVGFAVVAISFAVIIQHFVIK